MMDIFHYFHFMEDEELNCFHSVHFGVLRKLAVVELISILLCFSAK